MGCKQVRAGNPQLMQMRRPPNELQPMSCEPIAVGTKAGAGPGGHRRGIRGQGPLQDTRGSF